MCSRAPLPIWAPGGMFRSISGTMVAGAGLEPAMGFLPRAYAFRLRLKLRFNLSAPSVPTYSLACDRRRTRCCRRKLQQPAADVTSNDFVTGHTIHCVYSCQETNQGAVYSAPQSIITSCHLGFDSSPVRPQALACRTEHSMPPRRRPLPLNPSCQEQPAEKIFPYLG